VLVLGIGNSLLGDDGAGLELLERLRAAGEWSGAIEWVDGGTLGLSLLGVVEARRAVLILDAVQIGSPPGTMHVLRREELMKLRSGGTAHETGAIQLLNPAALLGDLPGQFAVVGIEPAVVRTGIGLSEVVCTALPLAIERAKSILDEFLLCV
jgi:hydrogenase maturation protease